MGDTILTDAERTVSVDRMAEHGHPAPNLERTAQMWSGIFGHEVTAEQVCLCMIAQKVVRTSAPDGEGHHRDNLVDIAGYARIIEMLWKEQERGKYPARVAFSSLMLHCVDCDTLLPEVEYSEHIGHRASITRIIGT